MLKTRRKLGTIRIENDTSPRIFANSILYEIARGEVMAIADDLSHAYCDAALELMAILEGRLWCVEDVKDDIEGFLAWMAEQSDEHAEYARALRSRVRDIMVCRVLGMNIWGGHVETARA